MSEDTNTAPTKAETGGSVTDLGEGGYRGPNPPAGFDIKGNEDSMKFHTPESPWYARTNAEVWFDSAEAAQKAGFVAAVAGSDRTDDADDDATEAAGLSEHVDADAALSSFAHTDSSRGRRKVRIGYVVSDKMDKTVVVAVEDRVKHKLYGKVLRQTRKLKAHDEANSAGLGDRVVVMETRPLSATKRWRLVQIVEKAR